MEVLLTEEDEEEEDEKRVVVVTLWWIGANTTKAKTGTTGCNLIEKNKLRPQHKVVENF
jgi:hypothetical protein